MPTLTLRWPAGAQVECQRANVGAGARESDVTAEMAEHRRFLIGDGKSGVSERDRAVSRWLPPSIATSEWISLLPVRPYLPSAGIIFAIEARSKLLVSMRAAVAAAADLNVGRLHFEVAERDVGERHAHRRSCPRTFGGYLERDVGGLVERVAEGDCGRAQIARRQ